MSFYPNVKLLWCATLYSLDIFGSFNFVKVLNLLLRPHKHSMVHIVCSVTELKKFELSQNG